MHQVGGHPLNKGHEVPQQLHASSTELTHSCSNSSTKEGDGKKSFFSACLLFALTCCLSVLSYRCEQHTVCSCCKADKLLSKKLHCTRLVSADLPESTKHYLKGCSGATLKHYPFAGKKIKWWPKHISWRTEFNSCSTQQSPCEARKALG